MTFENEFERGIYEAAEIKKSGRWVAMNQNIKNLANNTIEHEVSRVQVLATICFQNFSEYLALKAAYEAESEPSLLAWRARNLLEIAVWAIYCSASKENALEFYEEAHKDVEDIYKSFIKWEETTPQNNDWLKPIVNAKQDISQKAVSEGIESLGGGYKRVSNVAQDCGFGEHYKTSYKMLSKFCHPTAMLVMSEPDAEKERRQKDLFYNQGCLYFVGGFTELEKCLSVMRQGNLT